MEALRVVQVRALVFRDFVKRKKTTAFTSLHMDYMNRNLLAQLKRKSCDVCVESNVLFILLGNMLIKEHT